MIFWRSGTVDLTPYASSELLVRFRAKVSRINEDANVDNVKIVGTSAGSELAIGDVQLPNSWDEALSLGSYSTPSIMDDASTHTARIRYAADALSIFLDSDRQNLADRMQTAA